MLARGHTVRVHLRGTDLEQAEALWWSLPPGAIQATPVSVSADGADFEVSLTPQAPLGMYGLRAAGAKGLSNIHLFAVDDLPIVAAEGIASHQPLTLPVAVWGTCRPARLERFSIQVQAGEGLSFEAIGSRLGKDFDPLVVIRDSAGRRVAWRDNDGGLFFDCRFEHQFTTAGAYAVELSDARYKGADNWSYILKVGHFPAARVAAPSAVKPGQSSVLTFPQIPETQVPLQIPATASGTWFQEIRLPGNDASTWLPLTASDLDSYLEAEPNDQREQATVAKFPGNCCGCLQTPGDVDWFAIDLGQNQRIEVRGFSQAIGSPADLELALCNAEGQELVRMDDAQQEEAAFVFGAPQAGSYRLQVRDMARDGGPAFAYRIEVRAAAPRLDVAAEAAGLTVPQGTWQPIPLKITRTDYTGAVALELLGAPAGVTLEPVTVPAEANEFVARLRADGSTPLGVHTLQIVARGVPAAGDAPAAESAPPLPATLVRTQPLIDRQLMNVDRIIYALRDDQRRLPPSLVDRFALQITPPAPFEFEPQQPAVTLARFQTAPLPLHTQRAEGFGGPITFSARGGQLGDEAELRVQVFARIPAATLDAADPVAVFHSRNLVQTAKGLVYLDASADHAGRRVTLTRTFDLDVRAAFDVAVEPATITVAPGQTGKLKLTVSRVSTFAGPIDIVPQQVLHLRLPERITVPAGETSKEVEFQAAADCPPQQFGVRLPAEAQVEQYREDIPGPTVQIVVKKPE